MLFEASCLNDRNRSSVFEASCLTCAFGVSGYTPASDIFALMVTAFEIITRAFPFAGLSQPEVMRKASAVFEFSERLFNRRGVTEEEQREDWIDVRLHAPSQAPLHSRPGPRRESRRETRDLFLACRC